jgi:hypothetical protein
LYGAFQQIPVVGFLACYNEGRARQEYTTLKVKFSGHPSQLSAGRGFLLIVSRARNISVYSQLFSVALGKRNPGGLIFIH